MSVKQLNDINKAGLIAVLQADPSVPADRIPRVIEVAKGRNPIPADAGGQQEYYSTKESMCFLRCSRMSLHRAEVEGQIQSVRFRGKKLFERVELIKALKRGKDRK